MFSKFLALYFAFASPLATADEAPPGAPEPQGTLIEFQALDAKPAVKLRGVLSLPNVAKKKPNSPVVMMISGSECDNGTGWVPGSDTLSGKDEAIYSDIRSEFLKNGVAVFSYTKRGCSPLHGGTEDRSILVTATRANRLADAMAAFEALPSSPGIDPAKIFILGHSEGNTYAWELGRKYKEKVRGLLLVSFISGRYIAAEYHQKVLRRLEAFNLVDKKRTGKITKKMLKQYPCFVAKDYFKFGQCDTNHDKTLTYMEFQSCRERRWLEFLSALDRTPVGNFIEDSNDPAEWYRESYAAPSMVETVVDQNTPVALFQGEADTATPAYEAFVLRDALTEAKKPAYFFKTYEGLSHGLSRNTGKGGHCEKFGPVDSRVLGDLVDAVKQKL